MGLKIFNYTTLADKKYLKYGIWIVIICAALFLRLYKLKAGEVFNHNDDIYFTLSSLDMFHLFDSPFSFENLMKVIYHVFASGWGYLGIIYGFISILVMSIFNITLTERLFLAPYALISLFIPFYSYKLAKVLFNEKVAIFSASLIAVIPGLSAFSRTNGTQIINWTLFLMTLYYFIIYFSSHTKQGKYIAPICLGLYLGNDSAFIAIIPVLFFVSLSYNYSRSEPILQNMIRSIKPFFNLRILLISAILVSPLVIINASLALAGTSGAGLYGHTLSRLSGLGFHYQIIGHILPFVGLPAFGIIMLSLFSAYAVFKKNHHSIILISTAVMYSLPWIFLIEPYQKQVGNYIYFIIALIILGTYTICNFLKSIKKAAIINHLFVSIFILTFFISFISITDYDTASFENTRTILTGRDFYPTLMGDNEFYYGERIGYNKGFKTAGYYIRENTSPNESYFSDGPLMIMRYYTGRDPVDFILFTGYDRLDKILDEYLKTYEKADIIIIQDKNIDFFMKQLQDDGFFYSAIVEDTNQRLHIFTKKNKGFEVLDPVSFDNLFDKKYGNWKNLYLIDYFRVDMN